MTDPHSLIAADKAHTWHPFTQMRDWCAPDHEPLMLVSGKGAMLRDSEGREYLDGNSSIWTNLHGHRHPKIDAAIRAQLLPRIHQSTGRPARGGTRRALSTQHALTRLLFR